MALLIQCVGRDSVAHHHSSGQTVEFISLTYVKWASQDRVVVKRLHCEDKDVGSNPAASEKQTLGDHPTKRSPTVQQDLSGRIAI